jgi:hypothetical protein
MVKKRFHLLIVTSILVIATIAISVVNAQQERVYYFGHEYVKIWINQDRTIDLFYDRSLTLESGKEINWVEVGQPNGDFTIGDALDQYGRALTASDTSSGSNYKVRVNLYQPLQAGQTINFSLTTNVAKMIYNDTQNPGNVGMQFIPAWDIQTTIYDVQIMIVLPPNVTQSMVKTTEVFWNGVSNDPETGRLTVYWRKQNLAPNEQYPIGVSFPAEYVGPEPASEGEGDFFQNYGPLLFAGGFSIAVIGVVIYAARKKSYLTPRVSMETLGIRRGLTAVEASYLLGMKPTQIVTEILYSLLQKRAVWVESTNPALKLRIMPLFQNKTGTAENPLRYYEIDFLNALKDAEGTLDEEKLAHTVMFLRDTVEQKLRGYSRRDTVDYYRKIVTKAWTQVEQAGTVELASKAYDEQLLWLMLDPNYRSRTETTFRDRAFEPSPFWFWYWYGYHHYNPHPAYKPNVDAPAQAAKPPTIPGAEFANNIATAVEKTSSNIVVNIEKFANAIIPAPTQKASHTPARHDAECVCACAACACACACVSCACACAGGGVG